MKYESVIGLEVHAELATKTKIFCSCANRFGAPENTLCCPVCMGLPGTLPVLNKEAVKKCIEVGLALHCTVKSESRLSRKHYFYPDLPKAYQISQYDQPLCRDGYLDIPVNGTLRRIRIERIHIEEDAGKLTHDSGRGTRIDYNRAGVPLIEIVTRPDLRSPEEAKVFFAALRNILLYLGASDCRMQEGSLRCDVNVSLRPTGATSYGTRIEMKNVHSFRAAYRAMKYEICRQAAIFDAGGEILQETRKWDNEKGKSVLLRSKEDAEDYRFFPEPDLFPIVVSDAWIDSLRASLPELPLARKERYQADYALSEYDAVSLSDNKAFADYFEACLAQGGSPKSVCHLLMGDLSKLLNDAQTEDIPIPPKHLVDLLSLLENGTISGPTAKKVLAQMFLQPEDPESIVRREGLSQICSDDALHQLLSAVLAANPQSVRDYRSGKTAALGYLIGQAMRASGGKANPKRTQELFITLLAQEETKRPH